MAADLLEVLADLRVGLALTLLGRVAVLSRLVGGLRRPAWGLATSFYAVALVPALIVGQLDFAAHAVLYS